ncbi:MAG: hypothetical protein ACRD1B_09980 [Thermoanaerobaculia bacterium]
MAGALAAFAAQERPRVSSGPLAWAQSPYRSFGPARSILEGRARVLDEADDSALAEAIEARLERLAVELHEVRGWRIPFSDGDPLAILIARKNAEGVGRLAVRALERGHFVSPAIQVDATGLSDEQIVAEVARLYALATLSAYGVADPSFLTVATAEYLSGGGESQENRERAREVAAAPSIELEEHPTTLGLLFVEEFTRAAGGPASLLSLWEKAAETGEEVLPLLLKRFADSSGEREETLGLRMAARLYASVETEPAPSRVSLLDLQTGALDAGSPGPFALRHRSLLPAADATSALRVLWHENGAAAAAVVRYRDAALPPDVLFLWPGESRTIPLSGVARVDWAVVGLPGGAQGVNAPAVVETLAGFPYAGLSAHAQAGAEAPGVWWTTASHEELAGWAVFREEVLPDGRIERSGPEILPSSESADEPFEYAYVDPAASPGTYYRYTVWAVTQDGLLARAFSATLRTPD